MRKITSLLLLGLFSIFLLASCTNNKTRSGYCATFHLEGAVYQQEEVVRYYYPANPEGTLILAPNDIITTETDKINKAGYVLEGWYLSNEFKPEEKWDFETDRMNEDGVNLYAHWIIEKVYKFAIISDIDDSVLGEYQVEAGDTFRDYRNYTIDVPGYTFLEFKDEDGNVIEENELAHPGGDEDLTINIYACYIPGEYMIVKNFDDLEDAIRDEMNIYLYNDIDCEAKDLDFGDFNNREFIGNGYTISNFNYDDNLGSITKDQIANISLFDEINNSTIKDVTFISNQIYYSDFSQVSTINILPFAVSLNKANLSNVNVTYSMRVNNKNALDKTVEHDSPYLDNNVDSTIDNVNIIKNN